MKLAEFPYPDLLTSQEALADRLMAEDEGVALVETGYDAGPFLRKIAECADFIRGETFRSRGVYWHYDGSEAHGNEPNGTTMGQHHPGFYATVTKGFKDYIGTDTLQELHTVGVELIDECREALGHNEDQAEKAYTFVNLSNRVRGGGTGHIDEPSYLTVWHGATQAGLIIGDMHIPAAPAGYGIVWRGQEFWGEELATRHSVKYRSSQPRVSAVTF